MLIVIALVASYTVGAMRVGARIRRGRSSFRVKIIAMACGLGVICGALLSPLHHLANQLLSAHLAQHLLVMLLAAPRLVLGRPIQVIVWSLPRRARHGFATLWNKLRGLEAVRALLRPTAGWTFFCVTLILWHVPPIYRWAARDESRHLLMHASLLAASLLFWSIILAPASRISLSYAAKALFVLTAALITGLPGALIAFAPRPLYSDLSDAALPFDLTPLADQQLAGLIMWIPMDLFLFTVALVLCGFAIARRTRTADPITECATLASS
jgi:putative membrane protein